MLYLLGFVKWLGLYIWSLITVNPYDYAACLVSDLPGNSYRIVEKMFRIEIHTSLERMVRNRLDRQNTVERKNVYLRTAVGGFLANQEPPVAVFLKQIRIDHQLLRLTGFERLILNYKSLFVLYRIVNVSDEPGTPRPWNVLHIHSRP